MSNGNLCKKFIKLDLTKGQQCCYLCFSCEAVESKLVKLKTSRTVVSVLCISFYALLQARSFNKNDI